MLKLLEDVEIEPEAAKRTVSWRVWGPWIVRGPGKGGKGQWGVTSSLPPGSMISSPS
jgi:hypothetical protein